MKVILKYVCVSLVVLILSGSIVSCRSYKGASAHGWTDLNHAKELDHKKGDREKKLQKHYKTNHKR